MAKYKGKSQRRIKGWHQRVVSGGEPEDGVVDCLLKHVSADRVLFGSDAPGRSFAVQKTKVLSAAADDEAKRLMLGENIRRWLNV